MTTNRHEAFLVLEERESGARGSPRAQSAEDLVPFSYSNRQSYVT